MAMQAVSVNYLAVLVAAIASMALGLAWFSKALFGDMWMELSGKTAKQMAEAKKKGMWLSMFWGFVAALVTAYVLAHFVAYTNATDFVLGMQTGFWIWLGFLATTMLGMVIWDNKPFKLYLLIGLHELASLLLMGGILAVWH